MKKEIFLINLSVSSFLLNYLSKMQNSVESLEILHSMWKVDFCGQSEIVSALCSPRKKYSLFESILYNIVSKGFFSIWECAFISKKKWSRFDIISLILMQLFLSNGEKYFRSHIVDCRVHSQMKNIFSSVLLYNKIKPQISWILAIYPRWIVGHLVSDLVIFPEDLTITKSGPRIALGILTRLELIRSLSPTKILKSSSTRLFVLPT